MSIELLLLKPSGDEQTRLDMTQLYKSSFAARLLNDMMATGTLTPNSLAILAERFTRFLSNYRADLPIFPRAALLQFTELGPYWAQLVTDAEALYVAEEPEFDAALEEIIATVQIDMEEDHRIPYDKHRYYDTLLGFKSEYDSTVWRCEAADILVVPPFLHPWEYIHLAARRDELQKAVAAGCWAQWIC
jgi:hypothetical protein